jgi:hypothetical protein
MQHPAYLSIVWSPLQVLTGPNVAWLCWLNGYRYVQRYKTRFTDSRSTWKSRAKIQSPVWVLNKNCFFLFTLTSCDVWCPFTPCPVSFSQLADDTKLMITPPLNVVHPIYVSSLGDDGGWGTDDAAAGAHEFQVERERERERDTEKERETEREKERQRERERKGERERERSCYHNVLMVCIQKYFVYLSVFFHPTFSICGYKCLFIHSYDNCSFHLAHCAKKRACARVRPLAHSVPSAWAIDRSRRKKKPFGVCQVGLDLSKKKHVV